MSGCTSVCCLTPTNVPFFHFTESLKERTFERERTLDRLRRKRKGVCFVLEWGERLILNRKDEPQAFIYSNQFNLRTLLNRIPFHWLILGRKSGFSNWHILILCML